MQVYEGKSKSEGSSAQCCEVAEQSCYLNSVPVELEVL